MKLSAYLSSLGMSRAAFAAKVGTSRQNVSRWCEGVTPRRDDMIRVLAETEGKVTPNDFAFSPRSPEPPAKPQEAVA
jgi:transcriptional regulator with XRE-family HTH domain